MTDQERAMHMAIDQLREVRRANEILSARVETLDLMAQFLFARPAERGSQGMGEDAAWLLQKELDRLKANGTKPPPSVETEARQ